MIKWGVSLLAVAALWTAPAQARLFDPVFADHAVLQRDQPIRLWGMARPGATVEVALDRARQSVRADAAGLWRATLPARSAGGPYRLTANAEDGESERLDDIVVGDVFLCSGQSNMEFQLSRSANAADEIARADDPNIRLAVIPQRTSPVPVPRFPEPLNWQRATPASVPDFSAVCWYMARALERDVKVPLGLIDAAWGGSRLQAWLSPAALKEGGDPAELDLLALYNRDPAAANQVWGERWQQWWHDTVSATETPWTGRDVSGWAPVPLLDYWEKWPNPVLADFNGMVWYRTRVTLTAAQARQSATLDVGNIDEIDQSWVNGRPVGTGSMDVARRYPVPAGTLVAGDNVITINILDTWDMGGFYGPPEQRALTLADGTRLPLTGSWYYSKVDFNRPRPPRAPWYPNWGQGTLYNAMIAPLGQYGIRAMAWYQGESNDVDGSDYLRRLKALFADRRATFGGTLPILVVQLPDFGKRSGKPAESQWADVREAQRRQVMGDPHAGLAVTIDIGDPDNLHPTNKRPVGDRLARAALAVVYGRDIPRAGIQPLVAKRGPQGIVISFTGVTGKLGDTGGESGFELCGDAQGSCERVPARLDRGRIILPARTGVTRVRYCWGDSPVCAIRDALVPLTPFELKID